MSAALQPEPGAESELLYDVRDGVGLITLNRPKARNALTFGMYQRLAEICAAAPTDKSLKVLLITGAGDKAFAAGTDISQFRDFKAGEDGLAYEHKMDEVLSVVEACPLPMIAAIAGACTGGGAAIAAICDMRIATGDAKFGFPIARTLGNCLSATSLQRLVSLVGAARVTDLIFTSRLIGADEGRQVGLFNEVVADHAALMARGRELAAQLCGHAPLTMSVTKELLRRMRKAGPVAEDADLIAKVYGSADFREGLESFLAKRPPKWTGR